VTHVFVLLHTHLGGLEGAGESQWCLAVNKVVNAKVLRFSCMCTLLRCSFWMMGDGFARDPAL
jgi:hypothetical protein